MRLAVLTTSFPLVRGGSSGIFVQHLVNELSRYMGTTVLVPCGSSASDAAQQPYQLRCVRYAPVRWQLLCHRPGGLPAALRENRWLYGLLPILLLSMLGVCITQARRDDLILANWSISGAIGGLAGRLLRKPVVTTLRGTDVNASDSSLALRMFIEASLRLSQKVVLVSEGMRHSLAARYPQFAHKLLTIPNGVADELLRLPIPEPSRGDAGNPARLVVVANLVPGKGIDILLRAMARCPGYGGLTIVGDGPERKRLEALTQRLSLRSSVTFAGRVAPDKVKDYLRSADIFVLPSYSEGRPNSLIEAMAAGRAVVATDIDGVRELVIPGVNGLLVSPGAVEPLAEVITRLIDDSSLRRTFGQAARRSIIDAGLSWPRTAERYMELFDNLMNGRST